MHLNPQLLRAACLLCLALLIPACKPSASLPAPSKTSDGAKLPGKVSAELDQLFANRFARSNDSHFTVRITCIPDVGSGVSKIMSTIQEGGGIDFENALENQPPLLLSLELIEVKDLHTEVNAEEISKADKLNGIAWKGRVNIRAEVERRKQLDLISTLESLEPGSLQVRLPWVHPNSLLDGDGRPSGLRTKRTQVGSINRGRRIPF
ncbi:MAG: hypothetical protein AAF514_17835 [Verrucomicrobiota bacterium]